MQTHERWTLKWAHGEATVQAMGAMLAPVRFELSEGRSVSPMHVAPWGDDPKWPGLMRALRGEWPCLPFGTIDTPADLPQGFSPRMATDEWRHGFSSNHMWQHVEQDALRLKVRIDYPFDSEIQSLERVIVADPDAPALSISLTIHPRRDTVLPFALHPTFSVPEEGLEVLACPFEAIQTYPVQIEPNVSRITSAQTLHSLKNLPTDGGTLDVTRLPLAEITEELLQLQGCQPPFLLRYPANRAQVSLDWDTRDLPDAVMWISNGGRSYEPWSGRNFALGVEPANSFFDLGRVVVPPSDHPLAHRTGIVLKAGEPRTVTYRLSATIF